MARANRHYIPGYVWHLTHRCHKREFLLKFAKDRNRWMQWLYKAKKNYGLIILNYMATSNHTHLLVYDHAGHDVIPKSIQFLAGRTGQEYNNRKKRKDKNLGQANNTLQNPNRRSYIMMPSLLNVTHLFGTFPECIQI
jgi:putative transposase